MEAIRLEVCIYENEYGIVYLLCFCMECVSLSVCMVCLCFVELSSEQTYLVQVVQLEAPSA